MIFGHGALFDAIVIAVLCLLAAMLLVPLVSWIEWKLLVKKYGKEQALEIWSRSRLR